jgi:hypothetical protein
LIPASELVAQSATVDRPDFRKRLEEARADSVARPDGAAAFPVEWVEPRTLLTPQRFDFAAKHIYARHREKNVNCDWGRSIYAFHLKVWNGFHEEAPRKDSLADFLDSFHQVIDGTREAPDRGMLSFIPLARNGSPLNGAHRIVSALLLKRSVACVQTSVDPKWVDFGQRFFEARAASAGNLSAHENLDAMALEFCRMLPNVAIAVKFPSAKRGNYKVEQILSEHASVFYRKDVTLVQEGPVHLVRMLYERESWLGSWADNFDGARQKASRCFADAGPARFFLLAFEDREELVRAKERVRKLFGKGKDSMHITDTGEEALRVAKLAFSNPSIRFTNMRSPREMPAFNRFLAEYRQELAGVEDADDFCVDGSAVMAAYGIRDCADLDYISHDDQRLNLAPGASISNHNDYVKFYEKKILDDIVFDHSNHFYLDGMKFATLANLRNWKLSRGEEKDHADVALIDSWVFRHSFALWAANFKARARSKAFQLGSALNAVRKRITN